MIDDSKLLTSLGVVIIGRNEGDRLIRCFNSLANHSNKLVYVDSASTDDSVNFALSMGAEVVKLDMTRPFSAARARNEGFERMRKLYPQTKYVQFVDGDCEISFSWFSCAINFLIQHENVAAVCGRRRERNPDLSVYNMLCDMEWDTPVGETLACGGDALMLVKAFQDVGGFRSSLIAGEEPELCLRLRAEGWKIWRLKEEMTIHDAAMTRFGQWWNRCMRCGYAYAEGCYLHGAMFERYRVKESSSVLIWGFLLPLTIANVAFWLGVWGLALLLIYPAQIIRIGLHGTRTRRENWWGAFFVVLGKFPEMMGQFRFLYNRLSGKTARPIEYK
jgi:glycosyltransferase involved in cell wall biosynthesis